MKKEKKKQFQLQPGYSYTGLCLSSGYIENFVLPYLSENLFNNLRIHTMSIENSKNISQLENKFKTYQSKSRMQKQKAGIKHNDIVTERHLPCL